MNILRIVGGLAATVLVVILLVTMFSSSDEESPVSIDQIAPAASSEAIIAKENQTSPSLAEAQAELGMECIGSDVSMECQWNGVEYDFYVPTNWQEDIKLRQLGCDEGYINPGYNMVSDGSTWYATTDFEKDNAALVTAFGKTSLEAKTIPYCL